MAVCRGFLIDGAAEVHALDDFLRGHIKTLLHCLNEPFLVYTAVECVNADGHRLRHADGVGQLDLTLVADISGHDILCDFPGEVCTAAVNLRGVLAGECPAAVGSIAAVGVHNDFAPGQPSVSSRATDDETPGRIDEQVVGVNVNLRRVLAQLFQHRVDDVCDQRLRQLSRLDTFAVLGGDEDGVNAHRPSGIVIFYRDLRFAVRQQEWNIPILAHQSQLIGQLMCQHDRQRHELRCFITGVAEHHALVTSSARTVIGSRRNIAGLLLDGGDDCAGICVKAAFLAIVADSTQCTAGDSVNVQMGRCGDFPGNKHHPGRDAGFTGYPASRVLIQHFIQNGVRNAVTYLVRMSLGHGLRCKQLLHAFSSVFFLSSWWRCAAA